MLVSINTRHETHIIQFNINTILFINIINLIALISPVIIQNSGTRYTNVSSPPNRHIDFLFLDIKMGCFITRILIFHF